MILCHFRRIWSTFVLYFYHMPNPNRFSLIDPSKSPIFYGYIILVVGTLGIYFSIPGQTIGVSVFTDPVKDALGLSRNQFSNAYMIGTVLSSLLIGRAGIWFDRYGARYTAFFAALTLALALVLCSWSLNMSNLVKDVLVMDSWLIPFAIMTLLFFLIRFSGQGVLTMASRNVIMIWFDKNRGKVNAFSSIAISFGFSSSPLWVNLLIEGYNWDGAWRIMALGLLVFSLIILQFFKNRPEEHGLLPDGATATANTKSEKVAEEKKQYTLKEAKATRAFWMYGLILAFNSFFITGLTFHVVSIFGSEGYSKTEAISIFLPASVVAIIVSTIFNYLSDYVSLKLYLYLMIMGGLLASVGLLMLSHPMGVYLLVAGIGLMGGFFAVLNAIAWPRFFGRNHLGAITGKIMGLIVLASALAPSIFSFCFSTWDSYGVLGYLGLAFLLFLVIGSLKADNPQ